jgi:ABC-type nitrate/sulfonate/bicarbonate transport system substrate-binding protein
VAQVEGLGVVLVDYSKFDMLPVVLAANRPVVEQKPEAVVAFLRGWLAAVKIFKDDRAKAAQIVRHYFNAQGFSVSHKVINLMLSKLNVDPDYVPGLKKYFTDESAVLLKQNKIAAMPDWNKMLDHRFLEKAMNA